ncbi:hypothetical protein [Haliangium sp.]|uniref:hypothetical protein n=1 Tax=Haliangium sp. TaxID=2663208 RepID=UPI003D0C8A14
MGFLRKVAGAFVHIDDEEGSPASPAGEGAGQIDIDELTRGASDLLAQLEHHDAGGGDPAAAADPGQDPSATPPPVPSQAAAEGSSLAGMTADQVFTTAGLVDGPNSAQRVLKLIAGLTMFPREQQVVMVRAMDAADDSWSEPAVLEDARRRQLVLRQHLQALADERAAQVARIREQIETTRSEGQAIAADIDRRIAELQQKREEAIVTTTTAVDELEQQIRATEGTADKSTQGINGVVDALSNLINFFGQGTGEPPPEPNQP